MALNSYFITAARDAPRRYAQAKALEQHGH
jgi:hypothetical protein